jgi:oxygen-independent coproporphyrinogen-3 oxidase
MTPCTSIYIHIPFCTHRCAYCDFNTYAGQESLIPAYVDALIREIEFVGRRTTKLPNYQTTIHTVFFGGGTPSLLSSAQLGKIFLALQRSFNLLEDSENTIEANPGTVSFEELKKLREIGINRISFGVQSANTEELRMLERAHDFFDVIEAVASARKAGFDNLNLDLIYGLPGQSLKTWQTTVKRIVDLHPEHISAYALTLEHGTPFGRWSARGLLPLPDPDHAAEMYEWASESFEANGFTQYEISNWAIHVEGQKTKVRTDLRHSTFDFVPTFACRHNLQYWRSLPYLAFGAGAHGYANGYRYSNVLRIKTYIERLNNYRLPITNYPFPLTPATVNHHKQMEKDEISEFMMTGLRLTSTGITEAEFRSRFGRNLSDVYRKEIEELLNLCLLERAGDSLRLTKRGRLLGNQVFMRFVE